MKQWVCQECRSTRVQNLCWVDSNTDEVLDDGGFDPYCAECDGETRLDEVEAEHYPCCLAPEDMGHMEGCPHSPERNPAQRLVHLVYGTRNPGYENSEEWPVLVWESEAHALKHMQLLNAEAVDYDVVAVQFGDPSLLG